MCGPPGALRNVVHQHPRPSSAAAAAASPPRVELNVTSHPANLANVRKSLESFASQQGFDDRAVAEIGLCVNEAMANVTRHAYAGRTDLPVRVTAAMEGGAGGNTGGGGGGGGNTDGERIVITVRDWGSGIDPSKLPRRERDPFTPGGVGMICLRQWMDDIRFVPQPDGGVLTTMVRRKNR
jgi:anti-sigma regulatory factor (Ser/Thr protein kinase)